MTVQARVQKSLDQHTVLLPPCSPNFNAQLERFHRSLKEECLARIIFFGESSLRQAVLEFLAHYGKRGEVLCRERLGGLLNYYYRESA